MDPDDLPPLSSYRQQGAIDAYKEAQEMNMELNITEAIIAYLQSWEFLFVIVLFAGYKAFKIWRGVDCD